MNNLVIIGHPEKDSFCYNGIFKTIKNSILSKGHHSQNASVCQGKSPQEETEAQWREES